MGTFAKSLKIPVESIGQAVIDGVEEIGQMVMMTVQTLRWIVRPPYRISIFLQALDSFGVGSLFIVLFTGLFTGLVMSYQSIIGFAIFNAETLVGGTVAISLARELGPVLTGLMVAGRTGSAMTTEIGTMRVTEQIDAMAVMAVNPIQYLVVPRVIAAICMMPILVTLFNCVGIIAAFYLSVEMMNIDPGIFIQKIRDFVEMRDLVMSGLKGASFGLAIAVIGCYKGFYASGGAKGVGEATTSSVVTSSIAILFIDYWLTLIMW
jgi:phospholipid/cholesterol/gamma-HCH transport system permease protein